MTADANFDDKISATDFFMEIFFHEFAHAIHEENLIKKLGGEKTVKAVKKLIDILYENNIKVLSVANYAKENNIKLENKVYYSFKWF